MTGAIYQKLLINRDVSVGVLVVRENKLLRWGGGNILAE